jgi:y4mF family transcriptional regulator
MPDLPIETQHTDQVQGPIRSVADLGQFIRLVRRKRRMTQQELADMAGVGRRFLLELEAGKTSAEFGRALQVAAALGIDLIARTR